MNDFKNMIKRALRTFFQAALGFAAANAVGLLGDGEGITKKTLTAFFVASVAAGIAALMNLPDRSNKTEGVEMINGPAIVKRKVEDLEELPMAGQTDSEVLAEKIEDAIGSSRGATDEDPYSENEYGGGV